VSPAFWFYAQNCFRVFPEGPEHFWSLTAEEQFYLFWPFIVLA
jgi:peptidoglycan/LPS O-acetylase OafA/YrhL